MTIRYTCTECGSVLKIKDEKAGTEGHCPKCKTAFRVPELAAATESTDAVPVAAAPSAEGPVVAAAPEPSEVPADEPVLRMSDDDAEPMLRMDDDDFDSPPMLSLSDDNIDAVPDIEKHAPTPVKAAPEPPKPEPPAVKKRVKSKVDDDFDPAEFLSEGGPPPKWTPPPPSSKGSDFGMGGLSMDDEPSPRSREPVKPSKPTPSHGSTAAAAAAAWDSKMAAKQMQKAIKDSRSEAIAAKEEAEKADRFDWAGFFKEFGLKGLAGLAGIILLTYGAYLMFDRMMGRGIKLPPLGYVSGTVTLDGTPLAEASVFFSPQATADDSKKSADLRPRTSVGVTDGKGQFRMVYLEQTEGVAVGQCRVWISKLNEKGKQLVTGEFNEMNLTIREVKSGSQKYDFAMTTPGKK